MKNQTNITTCKCRDRYRDETGVVIRPADRLRLISAGVPDRPGLGVFVIVCAQCGGEVHRFPTSQPN